MKRRLNILCVIVILVLSYSVLGSLYYMGVGASFGVKASAEAVEEMKNNSDALKWNDEIYELANMKYVAVLPHVISGKRGELLCDSVYIVPIYSTGAMCVACDVWEDCW